MGGCNVSGTNEGRNESRRIDIELKKYSESRHNDIKMLLLGPGESGKSTVFKQMKIIQDRGGFSSEELLTFRSVIHSNCLSQMKVLITAATNLQVSLDSQQSLQAAEKLLQLHHQGVSLSPEIAGLITTLWKDSGIKSVYDVDRISKDDYVPTLDDVLRARIRSTGIEQAEFTFEKLTFTMVDVGGQRSERRKWIHCFDNVTVIIFCAALSEYDQTLREERSQNRMIETLLLFEEITNSTYFPPKIPIILFLNKTDLFDDKILKVPLTVCFTEYVGSTPDEAKKYITDRFIEKSSVPDRKIYTHYTCALNTKKIKYVITAVRETIMINDLGEVGL